MQTQGRIYLTYDQAEPLIKEGYVLLFRGQTWASKLIQKASDGLYSHVGLATWTNGRNNPPILECVEFKEWKGGRTVNLANYMRTHDGLIDVFAPTEPVYTYRFDPVTKTISKIRHFYNGRLLTNAMRRSTGLPYGWSRIWWLARFHLPFLRAFTRDNSFDDSVRDELIYPVCSTAIAHYCSKYYVDLIKYRSDERTEPSDLARSPLLNYLFTLTSASG
jgi:hypothetical protein